MHNIYKDSINNLGIAVGSADEFKNKYITVDKIFDLFYHLFKNNGLIEEGTEDVDVDKHNAFSFTHEYPDQVANGACTVTFEVSKRKCADMRANSEYLKESHVQYRPFFITEEPDLINGGSKQVYMQPYDNEITLYCWAEKNRYAMNIASLIENIFQTAYYYIKQHVGLAIFKERGGPIIQNTYGNKRLIGIPIKLLIRTYEISCSKEALLSKMPKLIQEDIKH